MSDAEAGSLLNPIAFGVTLEQHISEIAACTGSEVGDVLKTLDLDSALVKQVSEALKWKVDKDCQKYIDNVLSYQEIENIYLMYKELEDSGIHVKDTAWRPPGDVQKHMRSLDVEVYEEARDKVKTMLAKTNEENELLMIQITYQRQKLREKKKQKLDLIKRCDTYSAQMKEIHTNAKKLIGRKEEQ